MIQINIVSTQVTNPESKKKYIRSGRLSAGMQDATHLGLSNLPSIVPFEDVSPMKHATAY